MLWSPAVTPLYASVSLECFSHLPLDDSACPPLLPSALGCGEDSRETRGVVRGKGGSLKPSRALGTGLTWSYELMKQKPQGAVPGSGWARGAKANSGSVQRWLVASWATGQGLSRLTAAPAQSAGEGNAWEGEGSGWSPASPGVSGSEDLSHPEPLNMTDPLRGSVNLGLCTSRGRKHFAYKGPGPLHQNCVQSPFLI